jgi:uncharacterized protein YciI
MSDSSWDAHHEHVKNKGLLAKRLYVVLTKPSGSLDDVKKHLPEHLEYQLELEAKGAMFAAGPFADDEEQAWEGEGMVILRANTLEEARSMAENDPMHKSGARTFRLRPWMLNEGSITLKVTYSNGKREVI